MNSLCKAGCTFAFYSFRSLSQLKFHSEALDGIGNTESQHSGTGTSRPLLPAPSAGATVAVHFTSPALHLQAIPATVPPTSTPLIPPAPAFPHHLCPTATTAPSGLGATGPT